MDYVEQCCSEHTLCASELPEFPVKMQLLALRVWGGRCPGPSVSNKMHLGRIAWIASGQPAVGPFSTSPAWSVPPALFPHHLSPETQGTRTRDPPSFRGHAGRLVGNASFRALWGCSPSSRGPARTQQAGPLCPGTGSQRWEAARHLPQPSLKFRPCPRIFG